MDFAEILKRRLELERQQGMGHKPGPAKPSPEGVAAVSAAMSLMSPGLGSLIGGTVERAGADPIKGEHVSGAVSDAILPVKNAPNRLDMFKKVSDALYARLLPQAREAIRSNDTPSGASYGTTKAHDFYHGTNTAILPSGNHNLPLIVEEVLGQAKLKDPLGTVRTTSRDAGREVYRGQLRDVVDAPEYYAAAPELGGIDVNALVAPNMQDRVKESFNEVQGTIKLNARDRRSLLEGLGHEGFGHGMQALTNMPRGADPGFLYGVLNNLENVGIIKQLSPKEREWFANNLYRMHTGEALAEMVENRVHLSPRERALTWPLSSVGGGANGPVPGHIRNPDYLISRYTPGTYSEGELDQLLKAMTRLSQRNPQVTQDPVLTYNTQQAPFDHPPIP